VESPENLTWQSEDISGLYGANKSQPTFAPTRRCKPFICTGGNSTAVADKSDDFLPSIINPSTPALFRRREINWPGARGAEYID
jgi:hypothetical protein